MRFMVIDLESNQPSNKIIEVGYIFVDTKKQEIIHSRSIYVNPNEQLSKEIIELTGIQQENVDGGCTLEEAYNIMKKDKEEFGVTSLAVQWGMGDLNQLKRELGFEWDKMVFKQRVIDVKSIYQAYAMLKNGRTKVGLAGSMQEVGLTFRGRQHGALADAVNTWEIMKFLINKMSLGFQVEKLCGK